jgi:hypothetical protein
LGVTRGAEQIAGIGGQTRQDQGEDSLDCTMLKKLLMLIAVVSVAGCGGGGNGSTSRDPIGDFLQSTQNAIEGQNLNGVSRLLSQSYLENCATREDVLDAYADLFNDPTVDDIRVDFLDVQDESVDEVEGIATFFVRQRIEITRDGDTTSNVTEGDVTLVLENGVWRELGNQQCNRAAPGTPKGVFGAVKGLAKP